MKIRNGGGGAIFLRRARNVGLVKIVYEEGSPGARVFGEGAFYLNAESATMLLEALREAQDGRSASFEVGDKIVTVSRAKGRPSLSVKSPGKLPCKFYFDKKKLTTAEEADQASVKDIFPGMTQFAGWVEWLLGVLYEAGTPVVKDKEQ